MVMIKTLFAITFLVMIVSLITIPSAFAIDTVPLPEDKLAGGIVTEGEIFGTNTGNSIKGIIITEGRYFDVTMQGGVIVDWKVAQLADVMDVIGFTPNPDEDICLTNPDLCPEPEFCKGWWCPLGPVCQLGLTCPDPWTTELQYIEILDNKLNTLGDKVFEIDEKIAGGVIIDGKVAGITTDWMIQETGFLQVIIALVGITAVASVVAAVKLIMRPSGVNTGNG